MINLCSTTWTMSFHVCVFLSDKERQLLNVVHYCATTAAGCPQSTNTLVPAGNNVQSRYLHLEHFSMKWIWHIIFYSRKFNSFSPFQCICIRGSFHTVSTYLSKGFPISQIVPTILNAAQICTFRIWISKQPFSVRLHNITLDCEHYLEK